MAKVLRGREDDDVREVRKQLDRYEQDHPGSEAGLYRQNSGSIRVRIIDDLAARLSRTERHNRAWQYLKDLSDDVHQQITVLLVLGRSELETSLMNLEFDDPLPLSTH